MAPRVPPPSEVLTFQGAKDYPIEDKIDDWGLTPQQQETYVELFRRRLAHEGLYKPEEHDYYTLRRFLRARTYDLDRATKMWSDHVAWRKEHNVDTILQDFYFNERDKLLAAYPQGYHKLDKQGRPVYIQLIGKINVPAIMACTTEERLFNFHVQEYERCVKVIMPVCSKLANRKIDQTFGIMDVRGVGLSALTGDVKRMLTKFTKTDQDNYPEMLGHICIINAPTIFRMVWSVVKGMIDVRTQQKIEILGSNYLDALQKHMDLDAIPEFLGGRSKGTLLDDVGPWNDPELMARIGVDLEALRLGKREAAPQALAAPAFGRPSGERDSGFLTPQGSLARTVSPGSIVQPEAPANGAAAAAVLAPGPPPPPPQPALSSIAEARSRNLIERVKAVEALLPPHIERQRTQAQQQTREAMSTRSAPEGSLLNRVEVVEEALETMLSAQELILRQVQQQQAAVEELKAAQARPPPPPPPEAARVRQGCCTIM